MRTVFMVLTVLVLGSCPAAAQPAKVQDPLLERLVGTWVLRGTIEGKETTHDLVAQWVLDHQYVQIHEVSREKSAKGRPEYEALVYLGVDSASGEYTCLWLDSTGGDGLSAQSLARAKRGGEQMAFLFKTANGSIFHTTFVYTKASNTWQWLMDGEEGGKLQPFARVKLTKK